jgi:hypothetical protein
MMVHTNGLFGLVSGLLDIASLASQFRSSTSNDSEIGMQDDEPSS